MCLICKCVITSNLHSQITTRTAGRDTSKPSKNKIHKSWLNSDSKLCTASLLLICSRTAGKQTSMSSLSETLAGFSTCKQPQNSEQTHKCSDKTFCGWVCLIWACQRARTHKASQQGHMLIVTCGGDNDESENEFTGKFLFIKRRKFALSWAGMETWSLSLALFLQPWFCLVWKVCTADQVFNKENGNVNLNTKKSKSAQRILY